jgi:DNA-binding NarL/FixJ family response regulator
MRLLVLSEVRICLDAIADVFNTAPQRHSVFVAENLADALIEMSRRHADWLLFDVHAAGALASAGAILRHWPATGLVAFGLRSAGQETACAEAGVGRTLFRDAAAGALLDVLHIAPFRHPRAAAPAEESAVSPMTLLSKREREIAALLMQGHSNKQIARHLDIAVTTAKNHVHNILKKLQAQTRLQAILALGHGRN